MALVRNTRRGKLRLAYGVVLMPGVNTIADDVWLTCVRHPVTVHYVDRKDIIIAPGPAPVVASALQPQPECRAEAAGPGASSLSSGVDQAPPPLDVEWTNPEPLPDKEETNLETMRAKDVIAIVQATADVTELQAMLRVEARSTVVRAMERRIAELGS